MYIFSNFIYNLNELEKYASICEIEKENNVQQSLKNLREQMIRENQAEQVVDIEIEIAVRNKVPVFLVGSASGLTAERASEYGTEQNWNEINN